MGDNFDPCECIWNHELSMRRLLSFVSKEIDFVFLLWFNAQIILR